MSAGVRRIRKKWWMPPRANDKLGGCWCVHSIAARKRRRRRRRWRRERERGSCADLLSLSLVISRPPHWRIITKTLRDPRARSSRCWGASRRCCCCATTCVSSLFPFIYMSLYSIFLCLFGKKERKFFLFFFLSPPPPHHQLPSTF